MIYYPFVLRLNADSYKPTADEREQYRTAGAYVHEQESLSIDDRALAQAHAVVVIAAKLTREHVVRLEQCRVIARFGTGVDNIDIVAATERGILVTNYPDFCVTDMAEHTMALLLAAARKLLVMDQCTRIGRWDARTSVPVHRVSGRRLGLIGYGRIGQSVAVRAAAFGLSVVFHDAFLTGAAPGPASRVTLDELLETSDFISIHVPLSEATRHMIGEAELRRMKPSAVIINTARGGVMDERALVRALAEGWIAGAALDVYEGLPIFSIPDRVPDHPLLSMNNVILTPHCGGCSVESLEELMREGSRQLIATLRGDPPRNVVNPEALSLLQNRSRGA